MRLIRYISNVIAESKKVRWLPIKDATKLTILVVIITLLVAFILGSLDYGTNYIIRTII
ncbi:MAG: preprotein translocase subunit SecE [Candidatus Campbellbacteria bacterium]|nr:preprotein translocase subunit SecE [Candidatus Campbellbacteria bacterium]